MVAKGQSDSDLINHSFGLVNTIFSKQGITFKFGSNTQFDSRKNRIDHGSQRLETWSQPYEHNIPKGKTRVLVEAYNHDVVTLVILFS